MKDKAIWAFVTLGIILVLAFAFFLIKLKEAETRVEECCPQERVPIEKPAGREPIINTDPKEGFDNG